MNSSCNVLLNGKLLYSGSFSFEKIVVFLGKRRIEGILYKNIHEGGRPFVVEFSTKPGLKFLKIYAIDIEEKSYFLGTVLLACNAKTKTKPSLIDTTSALFSVKPLLESKTVVTNSTPLAKVAKKTNSVFNVERAARLSVNGPILVWGWFISDSPVVEISVFFEEHKIRGEIQRYSRPDVFQVHKGKPGADLNAGIFALFDVPKNQEKASDFIIIVRTGNGEEVRIGQFELESIQICSDFTQAANLLLSFHKMPDSKIQLKLAEFVQPALLKLWKERTIPIPLIVRRDYGVPTQFPKCTVIIPLYGVSYFMRHQLAAFQNDPEMQEVELIYVIDDPRIEAEALRLAECLGLVYRISFSIITYGCNLGYSSANNIGVQQAKGKYILLLNSDVLPRYNGWLAQMLIRFNQKNDLGILGVRLVYPDLTIQHNGMEIFINPELPYTPFNDHPDKCIPENLLPPRGLRECSMVTGACVMLEKEFYFKIGMLSTDYIWGDFEDSDLCFMVKENNRKVCIDDEISLYHLERQSVGIGFDNSIKFKITLTNAITHAKKWHNFSTKGNQ